MFPNSDEPSISESKRSIKRLYGRRKGRPLNKGKTKLISELLPQLLIELPESGTLDPEVLFSSPIERTWLEIGFGSGEHLAEQAERNPNIGFIGCEPYLNGIANLLGHIEKKHLTNVRIFPNDASLVMQTLQSEAIDRCFVLFADPWPKKRHAERRFIGPHNIPLIAKALKINAMLIVATDDPTLAEWTRLTLNISIDFELIYDERVPPENWIRTRYEEKGLRAGRHPFYFIWRRVNKS